VQKHKTQAHKCTYTHTHTLTTCRKAASGGATITVINSDEAALVHPGGVRLSEQTSSLSVSLKKVSSPTDLDLPKATLHHSLGIGEESSSPLVGIEEEISSPLVVHHLEAAFHRATENIPLSLQVDVPGPPFLTSTPLGRRPGEINQAAFLALAGAGGNEASGSRVRRRRSGSRVRRRRSRVGEFSKSRRQGQRSRSGGGGSSSSSSNSSSSGAGSSGGGSSSSSGVSHSRCRTLRCNPLI